MPFRSLVMGLTLTLVAGGAGAGLLALAPSAAAAAASAKGKTVAVGGNVRVTVAPGWSAGKAKKGKLTITLNNPHAALEIVVAAKVKGKVGVIEANNLTAFVNGFDMTNTHVSGQQSGAISGSKLFTEAASANYTGNFKGSNLAGLAVRSRIRSREASVFAVMVAPATSLKAMAKSVMAMIESIATNP